MAQVGIRYLSPSSWTAETDLFDTALPGPLVRALAHNGIYTVGELACYLSSPVGKRRLASLHRVGRRSVDAAAAMLHGWREFKEAVRKPSQRPAENPWEELLCAATEVLADLKINPLPAPEHVACLQAAVDTIRLRPSFAPETGGITVNETRQSGAE